ncbi:MAG: adenosylcobinamide-GDP ribazoletransferase [Candidatus Nanopelagicales bacterium]|nr:adenosylcobinamide-GDP ribazoletransferase [Candidatus Nanopelagicales bacterium]
MPNALRLALGTFTRVPVPPPTIVNNSIAGQAIALAPLTAALLALVCGIPLLFTQTHAPHALLAIISVALLAWLTRGMHLDGLADVADGLGSNKPAALALEIARKSDIGPFGVVTLVFTLGLQISALTVCLDQGKGFLAFALALFASRTALTWGCIKGWPAARSNGLGAMVAESTAIAVPIIWTALTLVGSYLIFGSAGTAATAIGIISAIVVLNITKRRFGGVTGDVFGAVLEVSMTAAIVVLALAN